MKSVYIILALTLFACKSGKETVVDQQKEPLLQYSKGPCLGKCPVYDFWIYPDGNFRYKNVKGIKSNSEITGMLTAEEMMKLKTSLQNNLEEPIVFKRIRDLPVTKLRFNGRKYEFHATRVKEGLKKANTLIEGMVAEIVVGQ